MLLVVPVEPGREEAAAWAARELAGPEYQAARPGLVERAVDWLYDQLDAALHHLPSGPGGALGIGVLLALVLAAVGYALWRVGGVTRQARTGQEQLFEGSRPRSAQEYRAAADRAAAAGDWSAAVLDRFRAVVRTLEERTVLAPQPGRTANEAAARGGAELPELAAALTGAARLFDDVRYGDRAVGADADARLRTLDDQVGHARVDG